MKKAPVKNKKGNRRGLHLSKEDFQRGVDTFMEKRDKTYEEKLEYTQELMERALKEFGDRIAVSCSFGKDSMVMVDMARKINPDVKVCFANTGMEHRETLEFRNKVVKDLNLNYYEARFIKHFWQCVKEYGFPWPRVYQDQKTKKFAPGSPKCCYYSKERPLIKLFKEIDVEATFIGFSVDESRNRQFTLIKMGDWYFNKKHKHWKLYPIGYWTTPEVWRYTKENNLLVNPKYEIVDRVGCISCTSHLGWREQIARCNPRLYLLILRKMREIGDPRGSQTIQEEFINNIMNEAEPCLNNEGVL